MNQRNGTVYRRGYTLKDIEKVAVYKGVLSGMNAGGLTQSNTATEVSVAELFNIVKKYDANFKPIKANNELLDEEGQPRLFYQGSASTDIHVFNPNIDDTKLRINRIGGGNYFTPEREYAEKYKKDTGKVYAAYLNVKNPYVLHGTRLEAAKMIADDLGIVLEDRRRENGYILEGNVNLQEALRKAGYDGVILYKPFTDGLWKVGSKGSTLAELWDEQLVKLDPGFFKSRICDATDSKTDVNELDMPCLPFPRNSRRFQSPMTPILPLPSPDFRLPDLTENKKSVHNDLL